MGKCRPVRARRRALITAWMHAHVTGSALAAAPNLTFARDPVRFGASIKCTDTPTPCDLSAYVTPRVNVSSLIQIIHYSGARCRKQLAKANYGTVSFVDVLDAKRIPIETLNACVAPQFCSNLGEMTQASCSLKHMVAWAVAARAHRRISVIIEDDMLPAEDFQPRLAAAMRALPKGWEVFNFGCSRSLSVSAGGQFCSRAYAVTRAGAQKMLEARPRVVSTCDGMVLQASGPLQAYHMALPLTHGSVVRGKALPRGWDLCNRSSIEPAAAVQRARQYYARANAELHATADAKARRPARG